MSFPRVFNEGEPSLHENIHCCFMVVQLLEILIILFFAIISFSTKYLVYGLFDIFITLKLILFYVIFLPVMVLVAIEEYKDVEDQKPQDKIPI